MRRNTQASGPAGSGPGAPPTPQIAVRYVDRDRERARAGSPANQLTSSSSATWTVWSAWPGHPAILPPLPREARSSLANEVTEAIAPAQQRQPARRGAPARSARPEQRRSAEAPTSGARRYTVSTPAFSPAPAPQRRPARHVSPATSGEARPVKPAARQRAHARAPASPRAPASRSFPRISTGQSALTTG